MASAKEINNKERTRIRSLIKESLTSQGYTVDGQSILPPSNLNKDKIRALHQTAVEHRIDTASAGLKRHESWLLSSIANGNQVVPEKVQPKLIEVLPNSDDELLFRYARLHWSIPVSAGYGRRLRFLVRDQFNGKLMGIIGLGDPVFALTARDDWVGWNKSERNERLRYVMDAFVLGAVPPYSDLLCGKLIAMLLTSHDVTEAFSRKYKDKDSLIAERRQDGRLALITTTSALGRSSIYRRLKYKEEKIFHSCGFTKGSGEFHFANGTYSELVEYANTYCTPTAKKNSWGTGYRSRRELIHKVLLSVGLSKKCLYHGIEREVFVAPLASNSKEFLAGSSESLAYYNNDPKDISAWFRWRWLVPRSSRIERWREFNRESYRLWD